MLSSTSVSSTGNIHRCVILFPFVVSSSGSVCGAAKGAATAFRVNAIGVEGVLFFSSQNEHGARERGAPLTPSETGSHSSVRTFVGDRFWTLIRDGAIHLSLSFALADGGSGCSSFDRRGGSVKSACEDIYDAGCRTGRTHNECLRLVLDSLQPWRVWVPAETPRAPPFPFVVVVVEGLWKDPLCVPLEFLFL